jgi:hypothetical protein
LTCLKHYIAANPQGPSDITDITNETKGDTAGTERNETEGAGYIYTIAITTTSQNQRWKAYVGNVTGTLTLDNAAGSTIYDWTLSSSIAGRLYATRTSTTPSWTTINCTWAFASGLYDAGNANETENRSIEEDENIELNQLRADDNITTTFNETNHTSFWVGDTQIPENYCYNTNTYINETRHGGDQYADTYDEIILFDGTLPIYTTKLENDHIAYNETYTYDFQILLPEDGTEGFQSSTAYWFYVELT